MKKFFAMSLILFMILLTAIIKNSTKRIDDEIFITNENIRFLRKEINDFKLEYTYLSSGEKLMDFNDKFFEQDLSTKTKDQIIIIKSDD
tara:strand:- start:2097 stop:2363 length:267 start_codon:yes stop_codon:yes gene_type:complete